MTTKKILICDDEEGIRESLKLILEDHYNLIVTNGGEQCMEVIKNSPEIGLVLIDIKMPRINGLEALEEIRKVRPDVPVIVVTGYLSVETASHASKLGANSYIVKPFDSKDILEKVAKFVLK